MYELKFTIKQHTPIIHFQHNQDGATLRASEVKPKLDKFIMEKLTNKTEDIAFSFFKDDMVLNKFLVGKGEHPSLDYKLKIVSHENSTYYLPLSESFNSRQYPNRDRNLIGQVKSRLGFNAILLYPSLYFANADKIKFDRDNKNEIALDTKFDDIRFAIKTEGNIECSIYSFNEGLISRIEKLLPEFFLLNNFGTRQNKGFGSFTVLKINDNNPSNIPALNSVFSHKLKQRQKNLNNCFGKIKEEYQLLKSGRNNPYSKSKLFEYFINMPSPIRWEKRFLKMNINNNKIIGRLLHKNNFDPIDKENGNGQFYNLYTDRQKNDYKFIRALLGLAEQYEFLTSDRGQIKWGDNYIVSVKHKPLKGNKEIQRFKSPLFFKVIDNFIYLRHDNSYRMLLNENFSFQYKLKKNDTVNYIPDLKVPSNFDLADFLKYNISSNWTDKF